MSAVTPAARDVVVRSAKTFVQAAAPTGVYLYEHAGHGAITWPSVEAGFLGAAAAAISVLWNGSAVLLSARRERQLVELKQVIDEAVAAAKGSVGPTLLGPGGLVEPVAVEGTSAVVPPVESIPAEITGTPLPPPPAV